VHEAEKLNLDQSRGLSKSQRRNPVRGNGLPLKQPALHPILTGLYSEPCLSFCRVNRSPSTALSARSMRSKAFILRLLHIAANRVGLGGNSSSRTIAFQARLEF
jgi:hypothetical protein